MAKRKGWGEHDLAAWEKFFGTLKTIGQSAIEIDTKKYVLNDFIADANAFNKAKVHADADAYALSDEMKSVDMVAMEKNFYANVIN
jgi:NitT/TauT family transport system substrate-binding protein